MRITLNKVFWTIMDIHVLVLFGVNLLTIGLIVVTGLPLVWAIVVVSTIIAGQLGLLAYIGVFLRFPTLIKIFGNLAQAIACCGPVLVMAIVTKDEVAWGFFLTVLQMLTYVVLQLSTGLNLPVKNLSYEFCRTKDLVNSKSVDSPTSSDK